MKRFKSLAFALSLAFCATAPALAPQAFAQPDAADQAAKLEELQAMNNELTALSQEMSAAKAANDRPRLCNASRKMDTLIARYIVKFRIIRDDNVNEASAEQLAQADNILAQLSSQGQQMKALSAEVCKGL